LGSGELEVRVRSQKTKAHSARKKVMKTATRKLTLFLLTIAAAALTACGGGGGGAVAPTTNNPGAASPAPAQTPAVVAAPGPATYAAGTEEANVFALLNQDRVRCSFGALKQDTRLDNSASAHAAFLVANGISWGHDEAAGLPGYTGATEEDRAKVARYDIDRLQTSILEAKDQPADLIKLRRVAARCVAEMLNSESRTDPTYRDQISYTVGGGDYRAWKAWRKSAREAVTACSMKASEPKSEKTRQDE
jgi:hypothetical protein